MAGRSILKLFKFIVHNRTWEATSGTPDFKTFQVYSSLKLLVI